MHTLGQATMPGFVEALRTATSVTTPIGLIAFLAVLVLAGYYYSLKSRRTRASAAGAGPTAASDREKTIRLFLILAAALCALAMTPQVVSMFPPRVPIPPLPTVQVTPSESGGARVTGTFNVSAVGASPQLRLEYASDAEFKQIIARRDLTGWQSGNIVDELSTFPTGPVYVRLVALDRNGQNPVPGEGNLATILAKKD